jgi:hypothetical protein
MLLVDILPDFLLLYIYTRARARVCVCVCVSVLYLCEELGRVFDDIPRQDKKIFCDWNVKVGWKNSFKPTIRRARSYKISNDYSVRVVNFATCKNVVVKSVMFPHRDFHKYTLTSRT